jgi:hypothetical protein
MIGFRMLEPCQPLAAAFGNRPQDRATEGFLPAHQANMGIPRSAWASVDWSRDTVSGVSLSLPQWSMVRSLDQDGR